MSDSDLPVWPALVSPIADIFKVFLRCVIPVVFRKTSGEVNISHETNTMVVWIYDGI